MASLKPSKKLIKVSVIVVVCLMAFDILLSGINIVPFKFRNKPVSFITSDLTMQNT